MEVVMATNQNDQNQTENLSKEEKQRMHDNYSAMGYKGGIKGGNVRKEQMAHASSYTSKDENKEDETEE